MAIVEEKSRPADCNSSGQQPFAAATGRQKPQFSPAGMRKPPDSTMVTRTAHLTQIGGWPAAFDSFLTLFSFIFMRISSILRLASAALLLYSMSSFSGCEKENVGPKGGCQKKTTTTTPPGGAS